MPRERLLRSCFRRQRRGLEVFCEATCFDAGEHSLLVPPEDALYGQRDMRRENPLSTGCGRQVWLAGLLFVGTWLAFLPGIARAQSGPGAPSAEAQHAGRALRQKMLRMTPVEAGAAPTLKFPRVYGVLMDVPISSQHAATVFANAQGDASLYTTGTFIITGGSAYETVRKAALAFVEAADSFYDAATPTTAFPYPAVDKVRFYLLTFQGVRMLDEPVKP